MVYPYTLAALRKEVPTPPTPKPSPHTLHPKRIPTPLVTRHQVDIMQDIKEDMKETNCVHLITVGCQNPNPGPASPQPMTHNPRPRTSIPQPHKPNTSTPDSRSKMPNPQPLEEHTTVCLLPSQPHNLTYMPHNLTWPSLT